MKIRDKFIFLIVGIILSGIAIIAVTIYYLGEINANSQLLQQGNAVISQAETVSSRGKDLFGGRNLSRRSSDWVNTFNAFDSYFISFYEAVEDKKDSLLSESAWLRLKYINDEIWPQITNNFNSAQESVASIVAVYPSAMGFDIDPQLMNNPVNRDVKNLVKAVNSRSARVKRQLNQIMFELEETTQKKAKSMAIVLSSIIALISVAILLFSTVFVSFIRKNVNEINKKMEDVGDGDFSSPVKVRGNDEFATLAVHLNTLMSDFSSIIVGVKNMASKSNSLKFQVNSLTDDTAASVEQVVSNIDSMSNQIENLVSDIEHSSGTLNHFAKQIKDLVVKIDDQASSVEESSASITQMSTSLKNVSKITVRRHEAGEKLVKIIQDGGDMVQRTNELIKKTSSDVNSIMQITDIINTIADQTNLLAMNASIEAAHAGDAGKGFAVVASEIRKLAEMTNNNAKKIQETVTVAANRITTVLNSSNDSKSAFSLIKEETAKFNTALEEIDGSINEISSGSFEIMNVMNNLSHISQEIKHDSDIMKNDIESLDERMKNIRNFSETVRVGINEVKLGSEEVNHAMVKVKVINEKNSESIADLYEEVTRFKTSGAEVVEPSVSLYKPKADKSVQDGESKIIKSSEPARLFTTSKNYSSSTMVTKDELEEMQLLD
ncbi:MAG: HAMP domain-containing protein [Spirochaetales bacterium]|nr:HAMP domain-containing protein [Spirochaetales bacterium]